ncbi:hypothetical protein [Salinicoccus sp. YB14-2]|uniref:hypothetical protein n=1 Tax=Salinicoccus sp. YB14-2 TaxID=1572701 RepID=UPI00068F2FC5|nr:hypothetical protein [Salinicoccus sp. YB14-2]
MKYTNLLIVPTLVSTSIFVSTIVASADEIKKNESESQTTIEVQSNTEIEFTNSQVYESENNDTHAEKNLTNDSADETIKTENDENLNTRDLEKPDVETSYENVKTQEEDTTDSESKHVNDEVNGIQDVDTNNQQVKDTGDEINEIQGVKTNDFEVKSNDDEVNEIKDGNTNNLEAKANNDKVNEIQKVNTDDSKMSNVNDKDTNSRQKSSIENNSTEILMKDFSPNSDTEKIENLKISLDNSPRSNQESKISLLNDFTYSHAARVRTNNSGMFNSVTNSTSKPLGKLGNRTLFISGQTTYKNQKYYRIHSGIESSEQGWIKSQDLRLFNMSKPISHKKTMIYGLKNINYLLILLEQRNNILNG